MRSVRSGFAPIQLFLWFLLFLAAAGSLAVLAAAPPASSPDDRSFYEAVEVSVVNIEVFVTDRAGNPVPGLTREDFEIYEDRRKMEITHFFSQTEKAAGLDSAGGDREEDTAAAPPAVERTLAVFFDNDNLEAPARRRVAERLEGLAGELAPGDRFVLINADNSRMLMQSFAARDRDAIARALQSKVETGGAETRRTIDRIRTDLMSSEPVIRETAARDAEQFSDWRLTAVSRVLEALGQAVDTLAGLPGHKALFVVSGNLPQRPSEAFWSADASSLGKTVSLALARVVARANAGRVTLYGLGVPTPGRTARRGENDYFMSSFLELAAGSGGQFTIDPSDVGVLASRAIRDLATFYSLGYAPPPRDKEGRARRIEVKVKRPGLSVRYRESYRTKSGVEMALDRTAAALFLGETHNPLGIAVELGEMRPAEGGNLEVEVTVTFPLDRLTLLPTREGHKGQAYLFVASRDDRGQASGITQIAIPLRVADADLAAARSRRAGYRTRLLLRPEAGLIAVGLRDDVGNSDSTLLVPWSPPAAGGQKARS